MSEESPCIQPTDITIRTNVDPQDETITTTTIVHLPFQVAQQCPPPKVISWMKSHRPRAAQQSRPHASGQLQALIPLHLKRRSSTEKMKKNDHTATVFSIQVTVLGRVVVPPTSPHNTSSDPGPKQQLQQDRATEVDLAPVKTIPARLNRAETTSYVIHRTFEDFQTLSESVLRLQHALDAASYHHHHQEPDTTAKTGTAPMPNKPVLTHLRLHHPHPGLYQTLMSRLGFSTAKANQRAFDASSTTHGFDEEGAFERVLELNQYLENVWYWLMPENNPSHLDLSVEKHDIMQWLKPSSMSSHADGRQMKESQQKDSHQKR
ncbi:hypothetical protein BG011_008874 [Mortierella polycephala]|uniref:Uncharacterized protein n=1 Tax=Mortierella polycephala TaxID=41804 RepID=A0A9P6PM74_9FUNG|nr:hypothetical protein BG011_008874 [Mortierella polycephala]